MVPADEELEGTPMDEEQLAAYRASVIASHVEFGIDAFTCDDCPARYTCKLAFDPYNTDGDCLAEK